MSGYPGFLIPGWFAVILGLANCSLSNLDAVTRKSPNDGSIGDDSAGDGRPGDRSTDIAACPWPALNPGDTNEIVQVGSMSRSYFLHVPSTYQGTRQVPLVLDFHFLGNSGSQEPLVSPYPAATDREGVIIAFPDGVSGPAGTAWNIGPCCVAKEVDDVAFARALVSQLLTRACIDSKRIYAVGYALGGGMAHYLGCHAADVFAAISPAGFDLLKENIDDCKPNRPITVVSFRETSDTFVPYEGGTMTTVPGMSMTLLGAKTTFSRWAEIDGCTGTPSSEDANGCAAYETCSGGVEVVLCTKQAGAPVPTNGSIAWPILKRHPMP